jgi:hypothetical protein
VTSFLAKERKVVESNIWVKHRYRTVSGQPARKVLVTRPSAMIGIDAYRGSEKNAKIVGLKVGES